jgi:CO/xanthine dehydrogenase FAD-binding subunit
MRVHVDTAGHEQPAGAIDDLFIGLAIEIDFDGRDPTIGTDSQISAPFAVDVDHGSTGQQHESDSRGASTVASDMPVTVPDSLDAALAALASNPDATVLAGGTDLMVEVNDGRRPLTHVVALGRVPELRGVRLAREGAGDEIVIGASVTHAELTRAPVAELAPALAYAARTVGSPQIQNAGTIGGNLATASPAGDTLPVLVALGATVEIVGPGGIRSVPIGDFFVGAKRSALQSGELVLAVRVPVRRGPQDYLKVGVRNAMVIAVASLAISVDLDARAVGIGLGSVGPTPLAAPDACTWIAARIRWQDDGIDVDTADAVEFATLVARAARPIDDHRSTAEYRRHAVEVLARRALERCVT